MMLQNSLIVNFAPTLIAEELFKDFYFLEPKEGPGEFKHSETISFYMPHYNEDEISLQSDFDRKFEIVLKGLIEVLDTGKLYVFFNPLELENIIHEAKWSINEIASHVVFSTVHYTSKKEPLIDYFTFTFRYSQVK